MKCRQNRSSTLLLSEPITMCASQPEATWSRCRAIPFSYHDPTRQEHAKTLVMMSRVFTTVLRLEHPRSSSWNLELWWKQTSLWAHLSLSLVRDGAHGLMRFCVSYNSLHSKLCLCYFAQATAADLTQFSCYHFLLAQMKLREGQGYCVTFITCLMFACLLPSPEYRRTQLIQALSGASLCWFSGFSCVCLSLSNQWVDSVLVATVGCLLCVICWCPQRVPSWPSQWLIFPFESSLRVSGRHLKDEIYRSSRED